MRKLSSALILGVLVLAVSGCTRVWGLKVTEVGKREVELFLDEPDALQLTGFSLTWEGDGGQAGTIALPALASPMPAGTFLVVWEQSGYNDVPVEEAFTTGPIASVPGIKVRGGFFSQIDNAGSVVYIRGSRGSFVRHKVRDTVKFGPGNRPASGADAFTEDGTLGSPSGSVSVQRRWDGSAPKDTDKESDWTKPFIGENWGAPTP